MQGRSQIYTVKDGRFRYTCARCERKRYYAVPPGMRKKMVRCLCGQSIQLTLNHRAAVREATSGKAVLVLASGREYPVYICDTSLCGIGFNIPPQFGRTISVGQELRIKYRNLNGSTIVRKILIKNLVNFRVGAQFLDGTPPAF